jgi:hypothetical protein
MSRGSVPQQKRTRRNIDCCQTLRSRGEKTHSLFDYRQVFLNVLSNAFKYNREAGTVTVDAALADTGMGIPPESREEVFEPFSRLLADAGKVEGRNRTGHQPPAGRADWRPHGPGERGRRGAHLLVGVPSRQAGLAAPRGSPSQRKLGGAGISCP